MRRWGARRGIAVIAALVLIATACSGNKSTAKGKKGGSDLAAGPAQDAETTTTSAGAPGSSPASTAAPSKPTGTPGGASTKKTSGAPATGPNVAGTQQATPTGFTYTAANLFPADQDRIGLTDDSMTICMHAPLVFGPAFHDEAKDFQVWWQALNDAGGVQGRKVNMIFTDDQYSSTGGQQAAEQCRQKNPFFMTAGVGFDTVPAVRTWAEENKMLYLTSFATEAGLSGLKYSFELPPSVEHFGQVAGNYIGAKHPGKVAVVYRDSPNWRGGRDTFKAAVTAKGSKIVADIPVQQNQGDYSAALLQLQQSGAETVLAWINVLEFAQLEKQAAAQGFHPRWVTATFNLVTDTLGHDVDGTNGPPAVGLWVTPEFHAGDTSEPWSGEEQKMAAAYAKYDSGHTLTDTDWQVWVAFKQMTQILNDCGRDCTRNKLAGMFQSGYKLNLDPLCPLDFARGHGKLGSFGFNVMEVVNRSGAVGWKQVATCAEDF